jgi:hypothetical protein
MNDPNHLSPNHLLPSHLSPNEQLLATLRAATQNSAGAKRADLTSSDEPSLQETYAGFGKAMSALTQPIDTAAIVQSVLGRLPDVETPSAAEDTPAPAKPATVEMPTVVRRRRFWANPWSYAAVASIAVVAGLTWIENFSRDPGKRAEANELARWNGYTKIDEKLDRSTHELQLVQHVPGFIDEARPVDERIDDAEADVHALLNDMGLVPL